MKRLAMIRHARAAAAVMAIALTRSAHAQDDASVRREYLAAVAALRSGNAEHALLQLLRIRTKLGQTNPRLQADIVRAAAENHAHDATIREYENWRSLGQPDSAIASELEELARAARDALQASAASLEAAKQAERRKQTLEAAERESEADEERRRQDLCFEEANARVDRAASAGSGSGLDEAIQELSLCATRYPLHRRAAMVPVLIEDARAAVVRRSQMMAESARARSAEFEAQAAIKFGIGSALAVGGIGAMAGGVAVALTQPFDLEPADFGLAGGMGAIGLGLVLGGTLQISRGVDAKQKANAALIAITAGPTTRLSFQW